MGTRSEAVRKAASVVRVAAAGVAVAGCASTGPQVQAWNPAPVGTSWEAVQRNTGSFGKDTRTKSTRLEDATWKGAKVVAVKGGAGVMLQNPGDGRWLALLSPDGKPAVTFDPPAGWTYPMAVGTTWGGKRSVFNVASGKTTEYTTDCKVDAYEKVTVAAGTFDAFRVHCASSMDTDETYWLSPSVHPFLKTKIVRGAKNPSGGGTQETELIKAPS